MLTQYLSFIVSIVSFFACLYLLFFGRKEARLFYCAMIFSWSAGIVYYYEILFTDFIGHDASSILRLYQYVLFGSWFVFESIDSFLKSTKMIDRIKKLFEGEK